MNLVVCSLLFCGILSCVVSGVPSPRWLYEQIQALDLPDTHTKKSHIPDDKQPKKELVHKRKDGVKKLFNFLDSAIQQEESSGSGDSSVEEGSGQEQASLTAERHSGSTGLNSKQSTKPVIVIPKQEKSKDQTQQETSSKPQTGLNTQQTITQSSSVVQNETGSTGHGQQDVASPASQTGLSIWSGADRQVESAASSTNQQRTESLTFSPQQDALHVGNPGRQRLTYSPNSPAYARPAKGQPSNSDLQTLGQQKLSSGFMTAKRPPAIPVRSRVAAVNQAPRPQVQQTVQQVADSPNSRAYATPAQAQPSNSDLQTLGQQSLSSGFMTAKRPPAIPVRSRVAAVTQAPRPQVQQTVQQVAGGPHRSNIQSPQYASVSVARPYSYGSYYMNQHAFPGTTAKSPGPLQLRPYGQLKRQREQFHQQTRTIIPGRAPLTALNHRYPILQRQPPANILGRTRSAIQARFPYKQARPFVARAHIPVVQRARIASPYAGARAYYRSALPQQQSVYSRTAPAPMQRYGYPLMQQRRIARAVINRKPQPRTLMTSLTAAAARIVVPARPEAYEEHNTATVESSWSTSPLKKGAHAVRSATPRK